MKTVVVNLFAGAGAGKTTCAWEIATALKKRGYTTEYVSEYAKELVWEKKYDKLSGALATQQEMYIEQKNRVDRLLGQVDFVVTDSPTLLNLAYLKEKNADYEKKVVSEFKENENFCIFVQRSGKYETIGRIHSEPEAVKKDKEILELLKAHGLFFGTYTYDKINTCIENIVNTHKRVNKGTEKQKNAYSGQAFYNLEQLKEIPIADVAEALGIEVKRKGGSAWCKIRNEKTESCKLYETTNTFCDFGDCNRAGDTIDLVATFRNIDTMSAMTELAQLFGIEPEKKSKTTTETTLNNKQYEKIGIVGELATMNFDFNIDKYGIERTKTFSEKYRMTVNELKTAYPDVYANMIRFKAIPYVYNQRQGYYRNLWVTDNLYKELGKDLTKNAEFTGELRLEAMENNTANNIIIEALKGTKIKYTPVETDVLTDIAKIRSGEISFEIGTITYFDLKKTANGDLAYQEISQTQFNEKKELLENVEYAAFVKKDKVNIAVKADDKHLIEEVLTQNKTRSEKNVR